ncbi:DUF962 domain-containing protein [Parashewanella curva]|uniref:DUF962 domain-containing protein n=1 Tax=Parashewanella curva TaxID=2338552 RepID=A0A3L8Q1F5_9GAMM|nr:Mpo1-like protein [Parashewanella curva]RLV61461.1 DUF962 domain-containing protein [Parashewanella curva]
MKTIEEHLANYKSVHLNTNNIITHFIGIPTIIWSIMVWLSLFSFSLGSGYEITAAMILAAVVMAYYFYLNVKLAIGMLVLFGPLLWLANSISVINESGWVALVVFVIGWILQFLGHKFEEMKPAFIDDLSQLFIGPLFLVAEIYFSFGWLNELNQKVSEQAVEKRIKLDALKRKK